MYIDSTTVVKSLLCQEAKEMTASASESEASQVWSQKSTISICTCHTPPMDQSIEVLYHIYLMGFFLTQALHIYGRHLQFRILKFPLNGCLTVCLWRVMWLCFTQNEGHPKWICYLPCTSAKHIYMYIYISIYTNRTTVSIWHSCIPSAPSHVHTPLLWCRQRRPAPAQRTLGWKVQMMRQRWPWQRPKKEKVRPRQ